MICNVVLVVFSGHSTHTDCGSCSAHPKSTTLQNVPWLCASIYEGGVLRGFVLVFHRDICREHSLMTEAANQLSAAAGPELSESMNSIANLASD